MSFSGKTAVELLEKAEQTADRDTTVQALNSATQVVFDEAYRTGDDSAAVEFAENAFAPEIQAFYGDRDGTDIDYERWKNQFSGLEGESGMFHIPATESAPYEYLRDCMGVVEDEYDQIVGVHSGGLAPLYVVEDVLEADPVVLRYSHRDRGDKEVQITPEMRGRADFKNSDVLVVDDVVESGETFREVGQYLQERGAEKIDAVPVRTSIWDMSYDNEMLDLREGGVKYSIVDYERRKDYGEEGLSLVT